MANKFYDAGGERAAKVNDLFAAIAPRYDLINDLQSFGLHRAWKRRLLRLAAPKAGEQALDLCCGTGDVAFALVRDGAEVIGLDFSEPMLAVARQRQRRAAGAGSGRAHERFPITGVNPQFLRGDTQAIPFPDAHFDIVTVSYGLRNLASWEMGLGEMWRVAKPGGRLLVLDFGKPDHALWRRLYFSYLRWFVPLFGKMFCGDSQTHAYILESLIPYPAQRGVARKMQETGAMNVRVINLLGGVMSINCGQKPA